jgi:diguanylate cyclase (GGDEF)-like protein
MLAVGALVHNVLTERDSATHLRRLYDKGRSLCGLDPSACDEVVRHVGTHARELSALFNLSTGPACNADEVLALAARGLVELSREGVGPGAALLGGAGAAFADLPHDPLTGAVGRDGFAVATRRAFEVASADTSRVASVVHIAIEGLDGVRERYGKIAVDEALLGLATLLNRSFEPMGGLVCRVGTCVFAIVLPGVGRRDVIRSMEELRGRICAASARWSPDTNGEPMPITISAGVASLENDSRQVFSTVGHLVSASAQAAQSARAAGGDCVRAFVPKKQAA